MNLFRKINPEHISDIQNGLNKKNDVGVQWRKKVTLYGKEICDTRKIVTKVKTEKMAVLNLVTKW